MNQNKNDNTEQAFKGFKNDSQLTWADMCEDDDYFTLGGVGTPEIVQVSDVVSRFEQKKNENEIIQKPCTDFNEENEKMENRLKNLQLSDKTPKIVEQVNTEYVDRFLHYSRTNKLIKNKEIKKQNNFRHKPKKKKKGKCYTCFPERKVLKHIITPSLDENVIFHHDMWNRNMIIATPKKHHRSIKDFPDEELVNFFKVITRFCEQWNLNDYSLTFNNGEWKSHDHFHVKIKILEKIANRMRSDHFRLLKRNLEYQKQMKS